MTSRPSTPTPQKATFVEPRFLVPCAWVSLVTTVLCSLYLVVDLWDGVPSFAQLYYVWLPVAGLLVLQAMMLVLFVFKRPRGQVRWWLILLLLFSPLLAYASLIVVGRVMLAASGASAS